MHLEHLEQVNPDIISTQYIIASTVALNSIHPFVLFVFQTTVWIRCTGLEITQQWTTASSQEQTDWRQRLYPTLSQASAVTPGHYQTTGRRTPWQCSCPVCPTSTPTLTKVKFSRTHIQSHTFTMSILLGKYAPILFKNIDKSNLYLVVELHN